MSLSCKIIPSRLTNITLCFVILMLCFFSITFLTGSIFGISLSSNNSNVSALTYSTEEDISFTFAPSLSITLSDTDLVIDTLAPGNTAESNTITVSVASNTPYGYALYADVGSNDTSSQYYNTSDLIRNDNISSAFTSIATNASLTTLTTDNTWGYSTSSDNGTTWSTYNGLPTATSIDGSTSTDNPAVLIDTKLPADSQSIALKVAVRASTTQASGAYSNIINFYAVGKPEPIYYMQDAATIKTELTNVGDELQAIDTRDGKKYWVAKQADGHIWMTQNLDLCIGCEGTATLTSNNTDLRVYGRGAYVDGYNYDDNKITWSPASSAITSNYTINGTTVSPTFGVETNKPYSAEGGDVYIYTSNSSDPDTVYNSLAQCVDAGNTAKKCAHYHVGNYYSWPAAIASNDSSIFTSSYTVADNSVCPAGWKMPIGSSSRHACSRYTAEFAFLFVYSGITDTLSCSMPYPYKDNGFINLRTSPLYFTRGGSISGNSLFSHTDYGYYWSSNSVIDNRAFIAYFDNSSVFSAGFLSRSWGSSARCVAR